MALHATVMFTGAVVNAGAGAGETVIVLVCVIVRLHASEKLHVSVTGPPHGPGNVLNVDITEPLIKHDPPALLLYARLLATAAPHATVMGGAVANAATGAGLTVIVLV